MDKSKSFYNAKNKLGRPVKQLQTDETFYDVLQDKMHKLAQRAGLE